MTIAIASQFKKIFNCSRTTIWAYLRCEVFVNHEDRYNATSSAPEAMKMALKLFCRCWQLRSNNPYSPRAISIGYNVVVASSITNLVNFVSVWQRLPHLSLRCFQDYFVRVRRFWISHIFYFIGQ